MRLGSFRLRHRVTEFAVTKTTCHGSGVRVKGNQTDADQIPPSSPRLYPDLGHAHARDSVFDQALSLPPAWLPLARSYPMPAPARYIPLAAFFPGRWWRGPTGFLGNDRVKVDKWPGVISLAGDPGPGSGKSHVKQAGYRGALSNCGNCCTPMHPTLFLIISRVWDWCDICRTHPASFLFNSSGIDLGFEMLFDLSSHCPADCPKASACLSPGLEFFLNPLLYPETI